MKKEIIYHLFTEFGTVVSVSCEDFIYTLKEARHLKLPYHIEVDKDSSSINFVTLFHFV